MDEWNFFMPCMPCQILSWNIYFLLIWKNGKDDLGFLGEEGKKEKERGGEKKDSQDSILKRMESAFL
ncbi:MAG TPA: hypothetical protein VFR58_07365 [Flavisolibacter sp.]|nr:hypothetical protein [Flavisolibacter sp.]